MQRWMYHYLEDDRIAVPVNLVVIKDGSNHHTIDATIEKSSGHYLTKVCRKYM